MADRTDAAFLKARSVYEKPSDSLPRKPTRQLGTFLDDKKKTNSPRPSGAVSVVSKMFSRQKHKAEEENAVETPEYLNRLDALLEGNKQRHQQDQRSLDPRPRSRMRARAGSSADEQSSPKNDSVCLPPSRTQSNNEVFSNPTSRIPTANESSSKSNGAKRSSLSSSLRADIKNGAPKTPTTPGKRRTSRSRDSSTPTTPTQQSPHRRAVASPRIRTKSRHRSKSRHRRTKETPRKTPADDDGSSSSSSEIKTPVSRKSRGSRSRSRHRKSRSAESKMGDSVADFGKLSRRSHRQQQNSAKPHRTHSPVVRKADPPSKPAVEPADSSSLKTHHLRRLVSNSEDLSSIMSHQSSHEGIISLRAIRTATEQDRAPISPPRRGSFGGMMRPPRRRSSACQTTTVVLELDEDEESIPPTVEGNGDVVPMKDLFAHYRWSSAMDAVVDSEVRERLRNDFLQGRSL